MERDSDGDYTHKSQDWKKKLWLRATPETNRLAFYTILPKARRYSGRISPITTVI